MALSKRTIGIGYLVGTGLGLSVLFLLKLLLVPSADLLNFTSTLSGMVLALALVYAGYWLTKSDLDGEQVWIVAQWSGLGVAILTLVSVVLYLTDALASPPSYWRTYLIVSNIGAGGVVGALLGGVNVLRAEHREVRRLNQRNEVMNRVLRHNIRNEMNIVLGLADAVEDKVSTEVAPSIEQIQSSATAVVDLSDTARQVSALLGGQPESQPIDLAAIVHEVVDEARDQFPAVRFEVVAPRPAWIRAGVGARLLVEELIENSAKHNRAAAPAITCQVEDSRTGVVTLRVEDNGGGIQRAELEAIESDAETPLVHGSGMGLWLITWLTEIYDGSLDITSDAFGTVVELSLPQADRDPDDAGDEFGGDAVLETRPRT